MNEPMEFVVQLEGELAGWVRLYCVLNDCTPSVAMREALKERIQIGLQRTELVEVTPELVERLKKKFEGGGR